ncbi:hypothetical protein KZZ52_37915 [Dactylosporangium sp. AC04546]|uniref:hypothetical protein n=1 Tax=Dactylosporangium sp. AC04546 TaxID=2862460 RepID=UPI001EDD2E4B|nr:hypothetical protein [Dactylosporangium sp. AC04546]WVK79739.1 hypothetical protein KZZ52_37915 [Dactylosporangium sp. AC04546]
MNTWTTTSGGAVAFWHELPRNLLAGAVTALAAVPFAVAVAAGLPAWLLALTTVPPALALTGAAAMAGAVARGGAARVTQLRDVDPVLAVVLAAGATAAGVGLVSGGPAALFGAVCGAGLLLAGPSALAYGAVRGRRGLAAVRGGAILVAYRPGWAFTLFALACLGGFAAVASAGVLAVVVVPLVLTIAARQTAALLDEIDAVQARS